MLNFKEISKDLLFERKDADIEKCCVLFNLTEKLGKPIAKIGNIIDPKDLHEYGVETEPHVTGLYGILPSETVMNETQKVLKSFQKGNIRAALGECSLFKNDDFDVLKFDILSQDLNDINDLLTTNLDYQNSYDGYHPHMTVAYLKPGTGEKYVRKIQDKLKGFPLDFGPPIFSDQNQNHFEMELGYPDNECAKHPDTGQMNEDLGYGGGMGGGAPYMSGHMGVYNSPETTIPRTASQYARYNMMNNNTVVTSGYYDTIFSADIKKVMMILKELGFKVEDYKDDDEYSVRGMKRADQTHTMSDTSNAISSDDVMNDDSGINLGKDAVLNYLKQEVSNEEIAQMKKEQEEIITFDEIKTGLNEAMRMMKYPDKDFATMEVIKKLMSDARYYSSLGRYDINENLRTIKGTNMKADCNVDTKELGSIVRGMLAEKNKTGRQAFEIMNENSQDDIQEATQMIIDAYRLLDSAAPIIHDYGNESLSELIDDAVRSLDVLYNELNS
jgi:hypothetical protein